MKFSALTKATKRSKILIEICIYNFVIVSSLSSETSCQAGYFGRECERQCNCADQTESCFVHSGGCPSGCAPGFTREACNGKLVGFYIVMIVSRQF